MTVVSVSINALLEFAEPEAKVISALSSSVLTFELSFNTTFTAFLISLLPSMVIVFVPPTFDCKFKVFNSIADKLAEDEPDEAVRLTFENTFKLLDLREPALTFAFVTALTSAFSLVTPIPAKPACAFLARTSALISPASSVFVLTPAATLVFPLFSIVKPELLIPELNCALTIAPCEVTVAEASDRPPIFTVVLALTPPVDAITFILLELIVPVAFTIAFVIALDSALLTTTCPEIAEALRDASSELKALVLSAFTSRFPVASISTAPLIAASTVFLDSASATVASMLTPETFAPTELTFVVSFEIAFTATF